MPDDKMVFGIEFQTNAKKTSKEIKELDKDIKKLDKDNKDIEKSGQRFLVNGVNKLSNTKKQIEADRRETAEKKRQSEIERQKHIDEELAEKARIKAEKEKEKQRKKAEAEKNKDFNKRKKKIETEYKLKKALEKNEQSRLNIAKKFTKFALGAVASGSVIKLAFEAMQMGRNIDIASRTTNVSPEEVESLGFLLKKFGGNLSTASNTLADLQTRLFNFSQYKIADDVMQAVQMKFPTLFHDIFFDKNNNPYTSGLKFLENLSQIMSEMSDIEAQQLGQLLGLDNSVILLLRDSKGKLDSILVEAEKNAVANSDQVKKIQNLYDALDEFKRGSLSGISDILAKIPFINNGTANKAGDITAKLATGVFGLNIIDYLSWTLTGKRIIPTIVKTVGKEAWQGAKAAGKGAIAHPELSAWGLLSAPLIALEGMIVSNAVEKKKNAIATDKRERENLLNYGNHWGIDTGWDVNKNLDVLKTVSEFPLNYSTPQQLVNGGDNSSTSINLVGNVTINGTDTNNAVQVGNTTEEAIRNVLGDLVKETATQNKN
jgi:hypothetical protein